MAFERDRGDQMARRLTSNRRGHGFRRPALREPSLIGRHVKPTNSGSCGARVAVIIGLAGLLGIFALLTVLLGIFAPNRFFLLFAIVDLASALYFYRHLIGCSEMEAGPFACWVVGMTPVGCLAILLAVLRNWADPEVRADSFLQTGFMIAWGCAVLWAHLFGSLLGLDVLDYGVRGRNVAAVWAGVGLTIGVTLAAAGANVGQGQT